MRALAAAILLCFTLIPATVAEDQESRSACLGLLALAISTSGDLLTGFKAPGLAIPAHTFRADEGALHCLFISNENAPLYLALFGGKAFAFILKVDSTFRIPLSQ